jgi:hypothetical protein
MRTTFDIHGAEGWAQSANLPRRWPIVVFFLVAFGCGTAVAAAYEALSEMDGAANSYALAVVILLGAIVLAAGFGIWKLIESDAHDLSVGAGDD